MQNQLNIALDQMALVKADLEATIKAKKTTEELVDVLKGNLQAAEVHLSKKDFDLDDLTSRLKLLEASSALE